MDTGKLPAYRSSYLLRFHPYPRVRQSVRERVTVSAWENRSEWLYMNFLQAESNASFTLDHTIHGADVHIQLRQHHLSMPPLIVDLQCAPIREKVVFMSD